MSIVQFYWFGANRSSFLSFVVDAAAAFAEQERCAPQARQSHQGIDDTADDGVLTAEEPGYKVKLENADEAPVGTADNGQDQC